MSNELIAIKRWRQFAYSFIGLVMSNAVMLLFLLQNAIRTRSALLRDHIGAPQQVIPLAFPMLFFAVFSTVGWVLIGIPFSLLVPGHFVTRLPWPLWILAGALLGPLAVFLMLLTLSHGHMTASTFAHTGFFLIISVIMAGIAFVVYGALLRREVRARQSSTSRAA